MKEAILHVPSYVSEFQHTKMHRATQYTCSCKIAYLKMTTTPSELKFIILLCGCAFFHSPLKWKPVDDKLDTRYKEWRLKYHLFRKYVLDIGGYTWKTKREDIYICPSIHASMHPSICYFAFCPFADILKDFSLGF